MKDALGHLRIRNFKAIHDLRPFKLTPLTVLIGNNGSGKSSLIEALETLQAFVLHGIDAAMQGWRGFEHVRNEGARRRLRRSAARQGSSPEPIEFSIRGRHDDRSFSASSVLNERDGGNETFVQSETVRIGDIRGERYEDGRLAVEGDPSFTLNVLPPGIHSLLGLYLKDFVQDWQFLKLDPNAMVNPVPQTRTRGVIRLAKNGSNIAEYLLDIRRKDIAAFDGIIETVKHILPYVADIQPTITQELERSVYLKLIEGQFELPGWLLSTGTLRVLALLGTLRHPEPPPLILIEEVENGLDPRTISLIVDEFRNAVESRKTQVILTTHSPYLLDLLPLSSLVLVERADTGVIFTRPADDEALIEWSREFSPGQLYTMNRLSHRPGH